MELGKIDEARAAAGLRVGFVNVTDAADRHPKFYLDISDVSTGRLRFTFLNTVPGNWTITRVYFDDGEVMAIERTFGAALNKALRGLEQAGAVVLEAMERDDRPYIWLQEGIRADAEAAAARAAGYVVVQDLCIYSVHRAFGDTFRRSLG